MALVSLATAVAVLTLGCFWMVYRLLRYSMAAESQAAQNNAIWGAEKTEQAYWVSLFTIAFLEVGPPLGSWLASVLEALL